MKKFIARNFQNIEPSSMLETNALAKSYNDVINLSIGDPDLNTDKEIIDACYKDLLNGHTHYSNPLGYEDLRKAIIDDYYNEYNIKFNLDEIIITTSATHAMFLVLKALLDKDDEVIIFDPYFSSYSQQIDLNNGKIVTVKTYEENDYQLVKEDIEEKITSKTKAIIINNPANPTGVHYNQESYNILKEIVLKHDLLIIADDIYTILTYEDKFIPINTIKELKNRIITVRSFSKDYCMTGFRIGYILAPSEIINVLNIINEGVVYSPPSVSQRAALYAIQNKKQIQEKIINTFKERINYAYEEINKINFLSCKKPKGSIYLFVNIKKTNMTSNEFCKWFLEKYHILVLPGNIFGKGGEGYIRIALTVGIDKLKEAFERIRKSPFS